MMVSLAIYAEDLRYELVLEPDKNYVISNKEQAHLVIPAQVIPLTLKLRDSRVYYQIGEDAGECLEGQKIGELFFYFLDAVSRATSTARISSRIATHKRYSDFIPCHSISFRERRERMDSPTAKGNTLLK